MKSGLLYPNRFARITLQAMEEVIGSSGMRAIYNMANLPSLAVIELPDDMERQFDFADLSSLFATLTTLFGSQGARSLAIRAGRVTMQEGIRVFSDLSSKESESTFGQSADELLLIRFNRFSNFLNSVSDQITSVYRLDSEDGFVFGIQQCPVCWGQSTHKPICAFYEGMLEHAVKTFSNDQSYSVIETQCKASGAESCLFVIQKTHESVSDPESTSQENI
ncbi:MAG: hypothetical protein FD147_261 [Chloroflexi bacterium]|nr:MAG: hypothetical protein FD147_261 [Chloroflexota bacterium]MBA4375239.1 hypothetical protein [Anaerolinea sp.]